MPMTRRDALARLAGLIAMSAVPRGASAANLVALGRNFDHAA